MRGLLGKIWRDVRGRRLRNALTILAIVVGVAGVVAIAATTRAMAEAQRATYDNAQRADIAVFTTNVGPTLQNLIARQPNVNTAETRAVTLARFDSGHGWYNVRVVGIGDFGSVQLDQFELASGRLPGRGEIAFDLSVRELTSVDIGQTVAVRESSDRPMAYLTVTGFTRSPAVLGAGLMNRALAYTERRTVEELRGIAGDNYLLVRVDDPRLAGQTSQDIDRLLSKRSVGRGSFDIRDPDSFVGMSEMNTLLLLMRVFAILGAALSSVLVANTILAVVSEELKQIGIIKALGGRRHHIVLTYLAYAGVLGLIGTFLGLAIGTIGGAALTGYLTNLTGLQNPGFSLHVWDVIWAAIVGGLVTLGATMLPVWSAAGRATSTLLRDETVSTPARFTTSRALRRLTDSVATPIVVGLRNAWRRKQRSLATMAVVTASVAAFLATQSLATSVTTTVDELYALYGADAWISYGSQLDRGFARNLEHQPGVVSAEPWMSVGGSFGTVRTDIWGMPIRDPMYAYRLVEGTWLTQSNPPSAVLTSNLAERVGAVIGDWRELDVGKRRINVQIVGIVNDSSTYLGSTATGKVFMSNDDVADLRGIGRGADLFALRLTSSEPAEVDAILATLEQRTVALRPSSYAAYTDQASTNRAINTLTSMLNAMVVLVALVGVVGILNTLLVNIVERRKEFGILRALGAVTRQILQVLISEGAVLTLSGAIVGVLLSYPLARLLVEVTSRELFGLTFVFDIETVLLTGAIAMLAAVCASLLPGLVAARIRPIAVLRYE